MDATAESSHLKEEYLGVLCSEQFCKLAKYSVSASHIRTAARIMDAVLFAGLAGNFYFSTVDFSAAHQHPEDIMCQTGGVCR